MAQIYYENDTDPALVLKHCIVTAGIYPSRQ